MAAPDTARSGLASRADVATDAPARYAKQLLSHLGRKVDFAEGPAGTWTAHIIGSVARVIVGDGVLVLEAEGPDQESVARRARPGQPPRTLGPAQVARRRLAPHGPEAVAAPRSRLTSPAAERPPRPTQSGRHRVRRAYRPCR